MIIISSPATVTDALHRLSRDSSRCLGGKFLFWSRGGGGAGAITQSVLGLTPRRTRGTGGSVHLPAKPSSQPTQPFVNTLQSVKGEEKAESKIAKQVLVPHVPDC